MPDIYSLDEVTTQLAAIIARVKEGEIVVIADGGVPVAEIHPVAPRRRQTLEERLAELEARGELIARAENRDDFFPSVATVPGALQRFLEDRNR